MLESFKYNFVFIDWVKTISIQNNKEVASYPQKKVNVKVKAKSHKSSCRHHSMVSCLNELVGCTYLNFTGYWFGKGARIGSPLSQASWFLLEKMWKELRTDMVEMFLMKFDNLTLLRQNLCRECKACLLSLVTNPVWDPTSKGVTLAL